MSLRVLIVEDNQGLHQYFMRIFEHKLDVAQFEFVCASTIQAALEVLPEQWDVILMDYAMGESAKIDQMTFRNGADLVAYRRSLEEMAAQKGGDRNCPRCRIVGTSSNSVSNTLMEGQGADDTFLKLDVPILADFLSACLRLKKGHGS